MRKVSTEQPGRVHTGFHGDPGSSYGLRVISACLAARFWTQSRILRTPPLKDGLLWKAVFAGHPYFFQWVLSELSGRRQATVVRDAAAVGVHCAALPCVHVSDLLQ